tara:strand:- start:565 stop:1236 length:672 start_codon:yes stop_codon:yes gene_type:complete
MSDVRFVVNQGNPNSANNGSPVAARGNPLGELITMPWYQQAVFDGRVFQVQLGTENAPINSTTAIDDELVWATVDVPATTVIVPVYVEVNVATWTTGTLIDFMLEVDNAANRYSSGGTAFTPLNLNAGSGSTSNCTAYVGTDVAASAKTSGGSLEVARLAGSENAVSTSTGSETQFRWFVGDQPGPVLAGLSSLLLHFGAASADVTGYGVIQYAEWTTNERDL